MVYAIIDQLKRGVIVVCQVSRDIIACEDYEALGIGAFRSVCKWVRL